ncbi:MAG: TolC family protein [Pirellulales bacterium]
MAVRSTILLIGIVMFLAGCKAAHKILDPEYAQVSRGVRQAWNTPLPAEAAVSPVFEELRGPQPVETYIRFALSQNAGIQAARKRVDAAAMRVPQAASLNDPRLDVTGWPIYPNVPQTASGRMTVDMAISQEMPWFGKLVTKAAVAEEEVNAARAQLAAAELKTIEDVKRAYYELYFVQEAILVTRQDRQILASLIDLANAKYQTGKTSQQDVLRLQAELSNVDGELIRMEQLRAAAQADLAQVLHVSPETPLAAVDQLSPEDVPRDLDGLYRQAIASRPELHAMLAEIARDQRKVDLARLDYFPDSTFKFGWGEMTTNRALAPTADGIDNLGVGLGLNIPLYRGRLNAAVREAESTVVASAREYDQLKDETQRDVKRLFTQARSQRGVEALLRESIIPKTQQALEVAVRGYQVGDTEFADLIANWRELLRFHISQLQLEAQLRQTLAALERVVGGMARPPAEAIPAPDAQRQPLPPPD